VGWELSDGATGGDAPDLVARVLNKPEVAIRACRDAFRLAVSSGEGKLSDSATGGDAPDLVAIVLREPEVAIVSSCDPL
jgi:hypothetical protein